MRKVLSFVLCLMVTLMCVLPYTVLAETETAAVSEPVEEYEAFLYDAVEIDEKGKLTLTDDALFKGTFFETVEYMNYSKQGGIIVLEKSIKLEKNITLQSVKGTTAFIVIHGKDVRVDLNGYTLTQQSGSEESVNPLFVVPKNNSFKINDFSEKGNGVVNGVCCAVAVKGGDFALWGGTLKAQAQASLYPDDGEVVVSVTNKGCFSVSRVSAECIVEFNGKLDDGRTYNGRSCAVYIDADSVMYANGKIIGDIVTENDENLNIEQGFYTFDVSKYTKSMLKIRQEGEFYHVYYPLPYEINTLFNGKKVQTYVSTLDGKEIEDVDCVDVDIDPYAGGRVEREYGKIKFDLTELFKSFDEVFEDGCMDVRIFTSGATCFRTELYLDAENVKKVKEAFGNKNIFLEVEMTDIPDKSVLDVCKTAKVSMVYGFVDEKGERIETGAEFEATVPLEFKDGEFKLYSLDEEVFAEKEFEYEDDSISFVANENEKIIVSQGVNIEIIGKTLDIEGTISMVFYAKLEGVDAKKTRMLFWDSPQTDYTEKTALRCVEYTTKDKYGYRFVFKNIPSKEMTKKIYARLISKDENGDVVYGNEPEKGYSIVDYVQSMMDDEELKPLLVKMLNYGSAAQQYFGVEGVMANDILTEKDRVIDYTPVYRSTAETIEEMTTNGKCETKIVGKALTLEGDISINYYVKQEENVDEIGMLFWTEETFAENDSHIMGTQIKRISDYTTNGQYLVFNYDNIVSACMSDSVYARVYTRSGNIYRYGDIDKYSVKDYVAVQIDKNENQKLIKLLRSMLLYGDEAEKFFGRNK